MSDTTTEQVWTHKDGKPCPDGGCQIVALLAEQERSLAFRAAVAAQIERANALRPDDFKTGQSHLPPAFREINYQSAFKVLAEILNEIEAALTSIRGGDDDE